MIDAIDYGFVPGIPTFDNTPLLNKFVADKNLRRTLYFPSGSYWFNSQPKPIDRTCTLLGEGTNGTAFIRNYEPAYDYEPFLHIFATSFIEKLSISAKTSGGCAIYLSGRGASGSQLRALTITTYEPGRMWGTPIIAFSSDPLGIRDLRFRDLTVFAGRVHGIHCINTQGITFADVEYYSAGGTVDHITFQQYGVFDPNSEHFKAANVKIDTRYMPKVYAYGVKSMRIYSVGATKLQQNSTCVDCKIVA